jgi:MFS family permease
MKRGVVKKPWGPFNVRVFVFSGLATALCLIGGMILGGVLGAIVNERLPGHQTETVNIVISAIAAFGGVFVGGAVWGGLLSHITHAGESKPMALAGALGFGLTAIVVGLALTFLENLIVEQHQGPRPPIHNTFTMLFVPNLPKASTPPATLQSSP